MQINGASHFPGLEYRGRQTDRQTDRKENRRECSLCLTRGAKTGHLSVAYRSSHVSWRPLAFPFACGESSSLSIGDNDWTALTWKRESGVEKRNGDKTDKDKEREGNPIWRHHESTYAPHLTHNAPAISAALGRPAHITNSLRVVGVFPLFSHHRAALFDTASSLLFAGF
jgi:hypothetical protein